MTFKTDGFFYIVKKYSHFPGVWHKGVMQINLIRGIINSVWPFGSTAAVAYCNLPGHRYNLYFTLILRKRQAIHACICVTYIVRVKVFYFFLFHHSLVCYSIYTQLISFFKSESVFSSGLLALVLKL